ncbi:MAG: hypothetical protein PUE54_01870 [Bacteroidales bacterium]|nr:hypothetical protein [Bacteroidales bacterium]
MQIESKSKSKLVLKFAFAEMQPILSKVVQIESKSKSKLVLKFAFAEPQPILREAKVVPIGVNECVPRTFCNFPIYFAIDYGYILWYLCINK